ncbi:MAG: hypothetical protein BWY11_00025 [Firmicutes bacterium ADurb.Bin182]|nr:MAG: hypothetical protein BWY11_00025 [Firmicutes bacterium ADurb.Bin182]
MAITDNHAKESGHWYTKTGETCYEIEGKKGMRPTTLRDARKLNLVPSVTTIISCASAPQLVNWKIDQAILSSLTLTRNENETEQEYLARIKADAQEQAKKAAERGTYIHAVVQGGFEGEPISKDDRIYYESARNTLVVATDNEQWVCEKSFATERYGGKADLHTSKFLVDIKTTDKPIDGLKLWDNHYLQLAAYRVGLEIYEAQCGILYINSVTAESKLIWADEKELGKGWKCFKALLDFYYAKTGLGE